MLEFCALIGKSLSQGQRPSSVLQRNPLGAEASPLIQLCPLLQFQISGFGRLQQYLDKVLLGMGRRSWVSMKYVHALALPITNRLNIHTYHLLRVPAV